MFGDDEDLDNTYEAVLPAARGMRLRPVAGITLEILCECKLNRVSSLQCTMTRPVLKGCLPAKQVWR